MENYGKPETALDMALDSYKFKHSAEAMKCIEILMKAGTAFDPKKLEQIRGDKNFEYFINKFDLENSNEEMKALRMIKEEKKTLIM